MVSTCFMFKVHQPYRIRKYKVFDVGENHDYFSGNTKQLDNERMMKKVGRKCYLPMNNILKELLEEHPEFKCSFSFSGVVLEQMKEFYPEVLESFKELAEYDRVEIIGETYYHSLASIYNEKEFQKQVKMHREKIEEVFGTSSNIFANTELVFSNSMAEKISEIDGVEAVLAEGADRVLDWRSPNFLYESTVNDLKILTKDYRLSDDIAFRFANSDWEGYPLTADKYGQWIDAVNGNGEIVNLFMDYETFGEHQWKDTGIFEFMRHLPSKILKNQDNDFVTPSEAIERYEVRGKLDYPEIVSWADTERDLSAWIENDMQKALLRELYSWRPEVLETEDEDIIEDWRKLQISDHFYYMCTKWFADGDVHKYFNPYESPYEAYICYRNAFEDLKKRINKLKR